MSRKPFPLFLLLSGRRVLVVGGGAMASTRVCQLREAGAEVTVVATAIRPEIAGPGVTLVQRPFAPTDLDGVWLAIAAATPDVNRAVAEVAKERRVFVNVVDDPVAATAYTGGIVRRGGVTVALSTDGRAPALAGLLREGIEALLPEQVGVWLEHAQILRERWKAEAVAMGERRPLLLRALNELYAASERPAQPRPVVPTARPRFGKTGFVSLVGAGPGDPELLTLAAARRLAEAETVFYDADIHEDVLAHASRAHRFYVGKRAGRPSLSQESINRLLIDAARRGQRVVRLKAGDPFVFGRGGEEALALAEAGIPHEVVPGVSSALAAPALAGIPVTHRGTSAAFTVVSGHSEAAFGPVVDGLAAGSVTLVVLMGVGTRARLATRLLEAGWEPATPAAVVFGASTEPAFTWTGTLAELRDGQLPGAVASLPATIVIGGVVGLGLTLEREPTDVIDASLPESL